MALKKDAAKSSEPPGAGGSANGLASITLGERRHACAFFHSSVEEYRVLLPFIKQGFERGERAFHIVDPKRRAEHLGRLKSAGIDVRKAEKSGQFELRNWEDAYLRDGQFDQNEMLALVQTVLDEAMQRGFRRTRLVAHMEWALEDRPGVNDFVEYEAKLNFLLSRYRDLVVCTYDLAKFGADIVVDVLKTHPMIIIGGILLENPFFVPPEEFLGELRDRETKRNAAQGYINDLISVVALPAMCSGCELPEVVGTLLDVLLRILRLDFAYARLNVAVGGSPLEAIRVAQRRKTSLQPRELGQALERWLTCPSPGSACVVPNPVGEGEVSLAHFRLGLEKEKGVLVAASRRADFPTGSETVLLQVAANQTVIELQRVQVVAERSRADESECLNNKLHAVNIYLRQELDAEQQWNEIVGQSKALTKVLKLVERVAPTKACVLIQGETGTGKELIARAIHRLSDRKEEAFVKLNCAAIPTGLVESELFGHEKGAFTGAIGGKIGRFELADGGTIFLDEVGEIPLELQSKLLRVLQEQEFERVGSARTVHVDVRLVAATNRALEQMVADKQFRSDLYYRLKVFPIVVPPLRERVEDIALLVRWFAERYARQYKKSITNISSETMTALCRYHWPGNVRELENLIERCVILSQGSTLEVPFGELKPSKSKEAAATTLEDVEREHILRVLNECRWVIAGPSGAATKLGMKRTSLQTKMQKLGIARPV